MNYALIFAGGTGQRMNSKSLPKQFLQVHGRPILIHTLEHFEKCKAIHGIVVVCYAPYIEKCVTLLKKYAISKVLKVVPGGAGGQQSIYNGLKALAEFAKPTDIVLIHDGVRPVIDDRLIRKNIECVKNYGNAISVSKAIETVIVTENDSAQEVMDRSRCYYAKAPQSFLFGDIYECHKRAEVDRISDFIDSATMMIYYGYELHTVECSYDNIKITTPIDFYMFKGLLDAKEIMQLKVKKDGNRV